MKCSIRDAFNCFVAEKTATNRWGATTTRSARMVYTYLARILEPKGITECSQLTPESFLEVFDSRLSAASRYSYAVRLTAAIDWMVRNSYLDPIVARQAKHLLHMPKPEGYTPATLSREQVGRMYQYIGKRFAREPWLALRNMVILVLLTDLCLRVSEICNLLVRDVDMKTNYLNIYSRRQKIRLTSMAAINLFEWMDFRRSIPGFHPDKPLFISRSRTVRDGLVAVRGTTPDQVRALVKDVLRDCGVKRCKAGSLMLRRSGITFKLADGWSPNLLAQFVGYRDAKTLAGLRG
jgi:site-specific recombinase XerD